jgi:hypothetical protein
VTGTDEDDLEARCSRAIADRDRSCAHPPDGTARILDGAARPHAAFRKARRGSRSERRLIVPRSADVAHRAS